MRSFLISMPPDSTPPNVLIFLHGVGEAFIPLTDADRQRLYSAQPGEHTKRPGVRNVFNHGVPMILGNPGENAPHQFKYPASVPFVLPVFNDFGSDINNQPTLRAFKDYRFRGPDPMTVQAEYDRKMCEKCTPCKEGIFRTVCSHLGLLVAYDAGKVALQRSDLDFSNMRQSFGGGVDIYLGKDVIFKMAVALGGGEGTHPYFVIPSVL